MTLLQIAHRRHDAVVQFLRGYHGRAWRNVLKTRGLYCQPQFTTFPTVDRLTEYARKLGFRPPTCERKSTPRCVILAQNIAAAHKKRVNRDLVNTLLNRSGFESAVHRMAERAKSLAKAGQSTGQVIPLVENRPVPAGFVPESSRSSTDGTGGQNNPPVSLSAPRAILKTPRERLVVCKRCKEVLRLEKLKTARQRKARLRKQAAYRRKVIADAEALRLQRLAARSLSLIPVKRQLEAILSRFPSHTWETQLSKLTTRHP